MSASSVGKLPTGPEGFQARLLHELEPVVEENLNRHMAIAKDWMPHDYIPWSRGRDFAFLGGEDWVPEDSPLDPVAKTAMVVNLLTEDNLPVLPPGDRHQVQPGRRLGRRGSAGGPPRRAGAGIALRDYLVVTRGVDPVKLEALRMEHMTAGYDSRGEDRPAGRRLRLVPGARHQGVAPQHRRGHRLPGRRAVARPGSPRTTCT